MDNVYIRITIHQFAYLCCRKNLLEVPKIDLDFDFKFVEEKLKLISGNLPSLPALPQVSLNLPTLRQVSLETLKKLEVYEYLIRTLQSFILIFNTISWFSYNTVNFDFTSQINSTISNFYCFLNQVMEIINFSNKKSWSELKDAVNEIRKKFSSLSYSIPTNIQFRELADGRLRIYFLCPQSKYDTLLYVDITPSSNQNEL
jgi:hypothetical protein